MVALIRVIIRVIIKREPKASDQAIVALAQDRGDGHAFESRRSGGSRPEQRWYDAQADWLPPKEGRKLLLVPESRHSVVSAHGEERCR